MGPETLKAVCRAFDDAWSEIRHHFDDNHLSTEVARLRLANAILSVAEEDSRDADTLKNRGLQAMALRYRIGPAMEVTMRQRVHTPKFWRNYVEETVTLAEQMTDPECKRMLMGVADAYAQLARHAAAAEATRGDKGGQRGRS